MRVDMKFITKSLTGALLLTCILMGGGCARRIDLVPREFEDLHKRDPDLKVLRVYPSRRLLSYYPQLGDEATVDVTRSKVRVRGERKPHERLIARGTSGRIVGIDELNGMPRLWVTFFSDCEEIACAYGFVQTELQRYSLVAVPTLSEYRAPISYRRNRLKRNKLRMVKQRSLVELNEVLAAPRRSGKAKPIDLQIRKDAWRPTRKTKRRADGV